MAKVKCPVCNDSRVVSVLKFAKVKEMFGFELVNPMTLPVGKRTTFCPRCVRNEE